MPKKTTTAKKNEPPKEQLFTKKQNDLLLWIPSKELFFKIQPGTGDGIDADDRKEGYTDYFLWNTFKTDDLGFDGELELVCEDAGMYMVKEAFEPTEKFIDACLKHAFDEVPEYILLLAKPD